MPFGFETRREDVVTSGELASRQAIWQAMGACRSRPADSRSSHEQHAPMWVLLVTDVLAMGRMSPHQTLKAKGLLSLWSPDMFTVFVSHQWLGLHHPDPNGAQLQVLQRFLKNLIRKELKVEGDAVSQFYGGKLSAEDLERIGNGYVWLDFFSVPQLMKGCWVLRDAKEQHRYVQSIPSYVDLCHVFVALVPKTQHETGAACSFHSWLQRGWCRTEMWCKCLSTGSRIPIVVVKSDDVAQFIMPRWVRYPVHSGDFALEEDRASCSLVIQKALSRYVSELRLKKDKTRYRFYLSLFEEMTGLEQRERSVEEFLLDFAFSRPVEQYKGLGPVACAALSGDHRLVRCLANASCSLETQAPGMPEGSNAPGSTPLHLAVPLFSSF